MNCKEIIVNNKINFVAEVSSVFHLLCAMSYAYKKSRNEYINGIIFIRTHYVMNEPIEEKIIEFENLRIELIRFKTDYKKIKLIKDKSKENTSIEKQKGVLYVLSVKVPNFNLFMKWKKFTNKKIRVVLIDEGTGTYYNFSGLLYPVNTIIKKILVLLFNSKVEKYFLLKKSKGKLISNKEAVNDFVDLISSKSDYLFKIDNKYKSENSFSKYVIFISGLFVEIGLISTDDYKKKLYDLNNILEENNLKLLIKPYQSENLEKYKELNIELLQWDIPCEILFPVIKPLYTLGFLSTSMLTGKVLYNIDSIDLSNIFGLKKNKNYYNKYEKMFKLFEGFILRSDTYNEFSEIIKNK